MKLKTKKKSRLEQKEKLISNKEGHSASPIEELKTAYKSKQLRFDSEEIAKAILEDKDIRRGLTK